MSKREWWLLGLVAVAVVVAVGATVAHLLLPPRQSADVAMPGEDATPEQVVTAYLEALDAHDCGTAEALMVRGGRNTAERWCHDLSGVDVAKVGPHLTERSRWSGHSAAKQVVNVPVSLDLSWRPFHDDGTLGEGTVSWSYLLVRGSDTAPWRIFDQGQG